MTYKNAKTIDKQIQEVVTNKVVGSMNQGLNDQFADELVNRIKVRTQLGIGVDPTTGKGKKLDKLSKKYKTQRKKRRTKLGSNTTPAKSNLTATGQMLNALTAIKIKASGSIQWLITVGDRRGRDLSGNSSKIGNKKLVDYNADKGREFLGFTRAQIRELTRDIKNIIIRFIK